MPIITEIPLTNLSFGRRITFYDYTPVTSMMITLAERLSVTMALMAKMLLICVMITSFVVNYEVKSAAQTILNYGQFYIIFTLKKVL
jgi:hypothetical protein